MWGLYFIPAQGFKVKKNILMQDNKSTILMATNGRFSSSKRTKHIKRKFHQGGTCWNQQCTQVYYVGIVFHTSTRFQGQEEYSYARQQIDHPDGHKQTILVLEAHQAHQEQVLHDQG